MTTLINTALKALACGMGAVAITTVMSLTFVESTATAPWASVAATHQMAKLSIQPRHVWFGQSQPAVLVD